VQTTTLGVERISRVPSLKAAMAAMQQPVCGSTVRPPSGTVNEIWVPAASNGTDPAFYDVSATLTFK
jgi:hypothetical protein